MKAPRVASVAVAVPDFRIGQKEAGRFLASRFAGSLGRRSLAVMRKLFSHPSIEKRNFAVSRPETLLGEDPDSRIARFAREAVSLSGKAARKALLDAGMGPEDVTALIVNTCTGYLCPGLSTYLVERLGLSARARAYDLVGSGCGGAVPNLQIARSLVSEDANAVVLSVSVEICSATFQMGDDLSLILSNALFADGAAAALVWGRPEGLSLVNSASRYAPAHREAIRYVHKKGELHNQLSPELPEIIKIEARRVVEDLLAPHSLDAGDIEHWALHPGGEKIIDSVRDALGIADDRLSASRKVLREYGNMSSPTVWFVLREIMDAGMAPGDLCVMLAFGAGLSAHGVLFRKE
jgi:predicted naringenin-chalcone synthase